jgi:hypothetical protein
MNSGDLYSLFRSDVVDTAAPYLWTDTEVYTYMNDAYRMFARLTGGIPDATSDITNIPVVAGQMYADVSPLILKFRQAYLVSSGEEITVINEQDIASLTTEDYGTTRRLLMNNSAGPIRYMVIGLERGKDGGKVRWLQTPTVNDSVGVIIYRLPQDALMEGDNEFSFPEIGEEHVEYLMLHMKARAYGKQDAETFDRGKREGYKKEFADYCEAARQEWERYKHKTRVVRYGGL